MWPAGLGSEEAAPLGVGAWESESSQAGKAFQTALSVCCHLGELFKVMAGGVTDRKFWRWTKGRLVLSGRQC